MTACVAHLDLRGPSAGLLVEALQDDALQVSIDIGVQLRGWDRCPVPRAHPTCADTFDHLICELGHVVGLGGARNVDGATYEPQANGEQYDRVRTRRRRYIGPMAT